MRDDSAEAFAEHQRGAMTTARTETRRSPRRNRCGHWLSRLVGRFSAGITGHHIMSDTPQTDIIVSRWHRHDAPHDALENHARDLERENARLMQRESEAVTQATRDAARADANAAECGRLAERVRVLSELLAEYLTYDCPPQLAPAAGSLPHRARLALRSAPIPLGVLDGAALIAIERQRQIEKEQWSAAHDDDHTDSELAAAGAAYALYAQAGAGSHPAPCWPWHAEWWKPTDDPVRNLVKAGALIAAEIDRLQREAGSPNPRGETRRGE